VSGLEFCGEFQPGNGSSFRWQSFFSNEHEQGLSDARSFLSLLHEEANYSIFFEQEEEEESGPGLPHLLPLPLLPQDQQQRSVKNGGVGGAHDGLYAPIGENW
jgi:hypothetical protein